MSVLTFNLKVKNAGGTTWEVPLPRHNLTASVAPGVNDDSGAGYIPGSRWVDTTHSKCYICTDNTLGAAVWQLLGSSTLTSPLTTKGDVWAYSSADGRFPVSGHDGRVFQEDSSQTFGVGYSTVNFDGNNKRATNYADPVNLQDLVTRAWALANFQGKLVATVRTVAALPAYTYLNGVLGVGATITFTDLTGASVTVDGHVVALGETVLVDHPGATSDAHCGLYKCTTLPAVGVKGVWTRSTDMDTSNEFPGAIVFVQLGTADADTNWQCSNSSNPVVGTDAITFVQISGTGTYSADGTTLQLVSNVFSIKNLGVGTAQLAAAAVTLAKIQNAAANNVLLGAGPSGSGAPYAEMALGVGLSLSGNTLSNTSTDTWTYTQGGF